MLTYNYLSTYNRVYVQLCEHFCMIYTSDKKPVYIQFFEYLYLCILTFIRVIILICVISELSEI